MFKWISGRNYFGHFMFRQLDNSTNFTILHKVLGSGVKFEKTEVT